MESRGKYWCIQWRIQDFPWGGVDLVRGAVDPRGGYVSKILHVKTKESGPVGGVCAGCAPLDLPMVSSLCKARDIYLAHLAVMPRSLDNHELSIVCHCWHCHCHHCLWTVLLSTVLITETSYFAHICTYAPSICTWISEYNLYF